MGLFAVVVHKYKIFYRRLRSVTERCGRNYIASK